MKRTFTIVLALALVFALLAGCAGNTNDNAEKPQQDAQQSVQQDTQPEQGQEQEQEPQQDARQEQTDIPSYTPEEIRANNSAQNLLARHSAMTYTRTFVDGEGNTSSTICGQFTMRDGFLQTNASYTDETGSVVYSQQGYADGTYAGATYGLSSDGGKYMTLYANNEAYEAFAAAWLAVDDESSATETVTDTAAQDGAVIVSTRTEYRDEADLYEETLYYVDPETDDLLYMETTSYNTQDNSVVAVVETTISYDAPVTFEGSPFETIIASSDYCEVTLIVDPQQEDMTVCWYPVAHGTQVSFVPAEDYTLYADDALTQTIDASLGVNVTGAACNIFAVPRQG